MVTVVKTFVFWALSLLDWEGTVLTISYFATVHSDHRGRLYGVTYAQDPASWFTMTALVVHLIAIALTGAIGVVVSAFLRRREVK